MTYYEQNYYRVKRWRMLALKKMLIKQRIRAKMNGKGHAEEVCRTRVKEVDVFISELKKKELEEKDG